MDVLLNVDLGELADEPEALYDLADVANVACGGHAGDDASMARALALCAASGAGVGAHPSYPDREGFGRTRLAMDAAQLGASVQAQCTRLATLAARAQVVPAFMKPHGALYHAADTDAALARALVLASRAALGDGIAIIGPPGGALAAAAAQAGLGFLREGFADRGRVRGADGRWTLVPRGQPGALVSDPELAAAQARALVHEGDFDTLCVHGDGPDALAVARAVRDALDRLR